jgi:hypothetical protein
VISFASVPALQSQQLFSIYYQLLPKESWWGGGQFHQTFLPSKKDDGANLSAKNFPFLFNLFKKIFFGVTCPFGCLYYFCSFLPSSGPFYPSSF